MNSAQKNSVQILQAAVERIEAAEQIARPGTHEHDQYVKAALMNNWSVIRACVRTLTETPLKSHENA